MTLLQLRLIHGTRQHMPNNKCFIDSTDTDVNEFLLVFQILSPNVKISVEPDYIGYYIRLIVR